MKTASTDNFVNKERIIQLMESMDHVLAGYKRAEIIIACTRTIAAMLGPANASTRKIVIEEIPPTIASLLAAMDKEL